MFSGDEVAELIAELGVTHVIWLPDSGLGPWETALENSSAFRLLRVAREGEAWGLAAGLHIGGKQPLVVMQTTGLFESGDALRNARVRSRIAAVRRDRLPQLSNREFDRHGAGTLPSRSCAPGGWITSCSRSPPSCKGSAITFWRAAPPANRVSRVVAEGS